MGSFFVFVESPIRCGANSLSPDAAIVFPDHLECQLISVRLFLSVYHFNTMSSVSVTCLVCTEGLVLPLW